MRGNSCDFARLQHIFDAITQIQIYTKNVTFSEFVNNVMMLFACIKQLEIIGEASNHLPSQIQSKYTTVEWSEVVGMRNFFVHEYFGVDNNLV